MACPGWTDSVDIIKEKSGEAFSQVCGCICCLMWTGPCLTLIGIIFLALATTDSRAPLIAQYNNDIDAWTNIRTTFDGKDYRFTTGANGSSPFTLKDTDFFAFPTAASTKENVKTYKPLFYEFLLGSTVLPAGFGSASTAFNMGGQITLANGTMQLGQFTYKNVFTPAASKNQTGPPPSTNFQKLINACYVVGATFTIADPSMPGCYKGSDFSSLAVPQNTDNLAAGVVVTNCTGNDACSATNGAPLTAFTTATIDIRAKGDPMLNLFAKGLCSLDCETTPCSGNCGFGLTQAQKALIGVVCLAVGLAFCACVWGGTYSALAYIFRSKKK